MLQFLKNYFILNGRGKGKCPKHNMIEINHVKEYLGEVIARDDDFLYIPPHALLRPYISHYCVLFPTPCSMSDKYTVLPSANSVLGAHVIRGGIRTFLNGTNTKATVVGANANKSNMLLLVKFRVGGFFNFYKFNQDELADLSADLSCVDKTLAKEIDDGLNKSKNINDLVNILDGIFIKRLKDNASCVNAALNKIIVQNGGITARELSTELYYSEKHIRRMFLQCVGAAPKMFARIVRVNYALRLLRDNNIGFTDIGESAGFFDQSHFIHDFKDIFSLTPYEYIKNMSDFYNADPF